MEINSFERNEKDMIEQIFQMDPFDPDLEIDQLRNALINAQKVLKEKVMFVNYIHYPQYFNNILSGCLFCIFFTHN